MRKKILIGNIIAVALLTLVSFSSVVGYNVVKNTQEEIITDEYDNYTPIQLVFQLISKLRNHKDIESIETENYLLQIIGGNEELKSIFEKLSVEDCGCDDNSEDLTSNTQLNNSNNDFENYPNSVVNITRCLVLLTRFIIVLSQARIVGTSLELIVSFLSKFGDLFILDIIEAIGLMIFVSWVARIMIIENEAIELKCNWLNYFPPQPRDI